MSFRDLSESSRVVRFESRFPFKLSVNSGIADVKEIVARRIEKFSRVCSSWGWRTGSRLPRRTAANVWQVTKNRLTRTDCILIDSNMRARALLLSPASLCQTFVPRNYKDHLRAGLTRCIPRAFETTRFQRFHTRRILQNINKILMERFAVRIYRLRDSRYLQLVTNINENIFLLKYASHIRDPCIDLTNCTKSSIQGCPAVS